MAFTSEKNAQTQHDSNVISAEPYLGEIAIFPYNFAPQGWIRCDGQILTISQNTALFSLLGTTYGGDGETTFAVPDLRGRVPISYGTGPGLPTYQLGQKGGQTNTTLNVTNLPSHNHSIAGNGTLRVAINADPNALDTDDPDGAFLSAQNDDHFSTSPSVGSSMEFTVTGSTMTTNNTGNNTEFTNMQPYTALGYYIATVGLYPSE